MRKKILIVTPRSPFQGRGADELDRLAGIEWFIAKGYEVHVVVKTMPSDIPAVDSARSALGISIIDIAYKFNAQSGIWNRIMWYAKRIMWPPFWDGAAYEYFDPEIQVAVASEIAIYKPDAVWFDYTYLWPLYSLVPKDIPIYTRSINFEPTHFLDEDGRYPWNYIRVIPKLVSEWIVSKKSNTVFAITPKEQKEYQLFGARSVTLPLRGLPTNIQIPERVYTDTRIIHLGFTASTYSVDHNIEALRFILEKILPSLRKNDTRYIFHFTGSRLPESIQNTLGDDDIYEGYVPNMKDFWSRIDIALVPSLFGAGMQQKVFEPLVLGVPTITSKRAISEYELSENEVVCTEHAAGFIREIQNLTKHSELRQSLSENSRKTTKYLFGSQTIDDILNKSLL